MEGNIERQWMTIKDVSFKTIADHFFEWKDRCGVGGWYNMPKEDFLNFLKREVGLQQLDFETKNKNNGL